jgi:hypothetical protein
MDRTASEPERDPDHALDAALAEAVALAVRAGRWDVVATLARELEERRREREGRR